MTAAQVVPVVMDVKLPAGMAGPDPVEFDVRCFLVRHDDGVLLVDAGFAADGAPIALALDGSGGLAGLIFPMSFCCIRPVRRARWTLQRMATAAAVWGGAGDAYPPFVRPVVGGETVRGLRDHCHCRAAQARHLCLFNKDRLVDGVHG